MVARTTGREDSRRWGLEPRLIAGHFVGPYRMQGKAGKNDANDAAAVCEAASRPSMRFVPVKTAMQQGQLAVHRLREGYKEERNGMPQSHPRSAHRVRYSDCAKPRGSAPGAA